MKHCVTRYIFWLNAPTATLIKVVSTLILQCEISYTWIKPKIWVYKLRVFFPKHKNVILVAFYDVIKDALPKHDSNQNAFQILTFYEISRTCMCIYVHLLIISLLQPELLPFSLKLFVKMEAYTQWLNGTFSKFW